MVVRESTSIPDRGGVVRTKNLFRITLGAPVLALAVASLVGCGGGTKASPSVEPPPPNQVLPEVVPPPPPLPPPIREVQPKTRAKVKVIDPGGSSDEPKTLIEASRLAKARKRAGVEPPVHEITDENLKEYAEGAEVIMLEGEPAARMPTEAESLAAEAAAAGDIRGEEYWLNRALELRMGWRRTVDELSELNLEAAALRQQFYAEDDPYVRDTQVKPNWDRVLDQISALKEQSRRYEQELGTFIEDGQRAGALQGWLNNGWELEPTASELERFAVGASSADPDTEPTTIEAVDITDDSGG
ncbi:MAG: hypothetical protein MPN21_08180 [Thermoanaerobaculia bacterium]|nr:hypothetical protein [Thermoanaerobaculia bacterium]